MTACRDCHRGALKRQAGDSQDGWNMDAEAWALSEGSIWPIAKRLIAPRIRTGRSHCERVAHVVRAMKEIEWIKAFRTLMRA
jgi:hypothetical protein